MASYRGSPQGRDWTQGSHIVGRFFTDWPTRKAQIDTYLIYILYLICSICKCIYIYIQMLLLLLSRFSHVNSVRLHRQQPTRLPCPWDSPGKNTGVGWHFLLQCMKVKSESEVAQSCPALSDPMDCSQPGFSVHGIFQARVLEWVAIHK